MLVVCIHNPYGEIARHQMMTQVRRRQVHMTHLHPDQQLFIRKLKSAAPYLFMCKLMSRLALNIVICFFLVYMLRRSILKIMNDKKKRDAISDKCEVNACA